MAEKSRRSVEELERDIAATRADLLDCARDLEDAVRARLDWRSALAMHPVASLGAALVVGFVIGRALR